MERVYHGEKCEGMVTATFWVEGDRVGARFDDGDISSSNVEYRVERTGRGKYKISKRDQLHTPLDATWGKNSPDEKSKKVQAKNKKDVLRAMIDYIVEPWENPGPNSMPVDAEELRKGLETALLR